MIYTGPATDLLLKLRPNIQLFHSSQYITDLANGDICGCYIGWRAMSGGIQTHAEGSEELRECLVLDSKEGRWRSWIICLQPADAKTKTKPISS